MYIKQLTISTLALLGMQQAIAQRIPADPALKTGRLPNGFTYYIRHNEMPRNRAQFYLVNKAGSVLEDDDQRGLAHFLEHMNFNGTKHFPKNELVNRLQQAGIQFGAELNAYTTFDETVYQLPIATDEAGMVDLAMRVMRDWAQEATLDPQEIEKERGIVLEEERLGKSAMERMSRQTYPVMLNHSRYAERLPIGIDSILQHFQRPAIKRFLDDWYRPDLQALIVVGDIDVAQIERMIKTQFGSLRQPKHPRLRPRYEIPLAGTNQFLVVTDKEADATQLQLIIKHKAAPLRTEADYLASLQRSLFNQLLNRRRYMESSQERNPAYVSASMGIQALLGDLDAFQFSVTAKEGQLASAFRQTWAIVERVRRYGFTPGELAQAKQQYVRNLEATLSETDKTPSVNFVKEYQRHFLQGEATPGIRWEHDFVQAKIDAITLDDIQAVANNYLKEKDRDILILAPEKDRSSLPGVDTIETWLREMGSTKLDTYKEDTTQRPLMTTIPKGGSTVSTDSLPSIQVQMLTLSNGVKVVLKPTRFKNDEIRFKAFAPGGTSVYDDSLYDAAASADKLIGSMGLGTLNPMQVTAALNGKIVEVVPYIAARAQGVQGACSPRDLETALQLVYLQFTQPRKDTILYNNIISRSQATLPNRYADPNNIFNDTMSYVMGSYHYRNAPPDLAKLNRITLQRSFDIYKERFANAAAFTFVFTGSFDTDSIRPLLEQYLGALPATGHKETAIDRGIHLPAGRLEKTVRAGAADKALVRLIVSGDYPYGAVNNQVLNALGQILQIRLLQGLRETAAEVYSPSVQFTYNKYPKNRYGFIIAFGCAPANVQHLVTLVLQEMQSLRDKGASPEEVEKVKAATRHNTELALKDNSFWLSYLSGQLENSEDLLEVQHVQERLNAVTPQALQHAAQLYLTDKNLLQFALLPAGQ
ncbi:insulinase family protein [Chitinophaga agrisoli]|uniref:Insulinase family protein n=1 Tax=Chitinophaga agrisoli TaxID=2607653 RepID=A0A5B2VL15_9BACT|nr:M16 family metallopeptidase [Chitinophaga agrisoli]KAA2238982.1 insulinase family protein [Chitinophaga agrisoli]